MKVPFLDLSRHVAALRPELDGAHRPRARPGHFVLGDEVRSFEEEFAEFCGARHVIGVASGTDAITLALQAIGVGAGDEVVTAANTCVPTIAAIQGTGATPVLADVEPRTRTLDPERLGEG